MIEKDKTRKTPTTSKTPEFKASPTKLPMGPEIEKEYYTPVIDHDGVSVVSKSRRHHDQEKPVDGEWISDESFIDQWFGPQALKLIAEMPDVIHGSLTSKGSPATLIVLNFKFQSFANDRRFKSARITVTFLDIEVDEEVPAKGQIVPAPAVEYIVPSGNWALDQSVETEETTWSGGMTGITGPGFTINAGVQYQHHEVGQKTDKATVSGTAFFDDSKRKRPLTEPANPTEEDKRRKRERKKHNVVIWNLLENPSTKQGIPAFIQGAILLKRDKDLGDQRFKAHVEIKLGLDWKTGFKSITHQTPENEPIVFDPCEHSEGKHYMKNRLDLGDLDKLQKIIEFLPMSQPHKPPKERTKNSISRPTTPMKEMIFEMTNVNMTGGNVIFKSGVAVTEAALPHASPV